MTINKDFLTNKCVFANQNKKLILPLKTSALDNVFGCPASESCVVHSEKIKMTYK